VRAVHLSSPQIKLLEIGLGCGMPYGEGHSVLVWRQYFETVPDLQLWFAEYNGECATKWLEKHPNTTKLLIGDQADEPTLNRWMNESDALQRGFDIIIDDGGHSWRQQTHSFFTLWAALAPGGFYFLEDLVCNVQHGCVTTRYVHRMCAHDSSADVQVC
jgi:hypothetical protein